MKNTAKTLKKVFLALFIFSAATMTLAALKPPPEAIKFAGKKKAPVCFSHKTHMAKYSCETCHQKLFSQTISGTGFTMSDISRGKACGTCHNGSDAHAVKNCKMCHKETAVKEKPAPDCPGSCDKCNKCEK